MDRRSIALTAALALATWPVGGARVLLAVASAATVAVVPIAVPPLPHLSPLDSTLGKLAIMRGKARASKDHEGIVRLTEAKTTLVAFTNSVFPYEGLVPDKQMAFLDAVKQKRRGHTSGRGGVYWEDETYSDRSVLLSFPTHFDLRRPAVIVLFFHGNQATLARDVVARQHVVDQVDASGLNAILVAPQLAYDAKDSSAGNFWRPGFLARFLNEASVELAKLYGGRSTPAVFQRLPVVVIAYSGGYEAAGYALSVGGATRRVLGVMLLDALYGEEDKFVDWITRNRKSAFFLSAYSKSSAAGNADVEERLKARDVKFQVSVPARLEPETITFLAADPEIAHDDFITNAWVPLPVEWLLARVPDYPR